MIEIWWTLRAFQEDTPEDAKRDLTLSLSDYPYKAVTYISLDKETVTGLVQCAFSLNYGVYTICWLCVDPDFQGQGIAKKLMLAAENHVAKKFLNGEQGTIFIIAAHDYKYYEKLGYKKGDVKTHKNYNIMTKIVNKD